MASIDNSSIRISVAMGIYNCAPTLAEALDSLLAQTYQGFKVIMCDDGSTDNTVEVAQHYVDKYPGKFILIRNERNMKLAYTLNHCIEYCDTEYVARMDGDDISFPDRFEKEINFLDAHPEYALVSCPMTMFDEDGEYYRPQITAGNAPTNETFRRKVPYSHAPVMFRKSTLDKVGNYTDTPRVVRREDYYLWYKIHKAGMRGFNLGEPLYAMRNDKNAFARRKFADRFKAIPVMWEIYHGLGIKGVYKACAYSIAKAFVPNSVRIFMRKHGYCKSLS